MPISAVWAQNGAAQTTSTANSIESLVATLRDGGISWQQREKIEQELATRPAEAILLAVMGDVLLPMPSGGIWNGGSVQEDQNAPPVWRIFYSLRRVWEAQRRRASATVTREVIRRLATTPYKSSAIQILNVDVPWISESEVALAHLMREGTPGERQQAGLVLIKHVGDKYLPELKSLALAALEDSTKDFSASINGVRNLMEAQINSPRVQIVGQAGFVADSELVRASVEWLGVAERLKAGSGYFLALTLGSYVGENFEPDDKDPRYTNKDGSRNPEFFEMPGAKALGWWQTNGKAKFGV